MNNSDNLDQIDINIDNVVFVRIGEKNIPWKYSSTSDVVHDTPFYNLTYVKNGGISSRYDDETVEFREGCLFLGSPPQSHYMNYSMDLPTVIYVITFSAYDDIPLEFYPDGRLKVFPSNTVLIEKLYMEALDIFVKKPLAWKISLKRITLRIFTEFIRALHEKRLKRSMPSFIKDSISYIEDHVFSETIQISELAKRNNISTTHFLRVFKQEFGMSPKKYIIHIKIESAIVLLLNTDKTIAEICEQTGFNDIAYFNRCFKSETGLSPSQFRKKNVTRLL